MGIETGRYEIELDLFERKGSYVFFSEFEKGYYTITTEICVDGIIDYLNRHNDSFYCLMTYLILKTCNKIENFCYRRIDNRIYRYGNVSASCAILLPSKQIDYTNHVFFDESINVFSKRFHEKKDEALNGRLVSDLRDSFDLVYISALPWFRLKCMNSVRASLVDDTIPRFSWGKYFEKENNIFVDLTLEISHAFIDGYHVHLFVDEIEKAIEVLKDI